MKNNPAINWRQEYLHVAVLLMTAIWFCPWLALSLGWFLTISTSTALGLAVIQMLVPLLLIRVMRHFRTGHRRQEIYLFVALLLSIGITLLLSSQLFTAYRTQNRIALSDLFHFDKNRRIPAGPLLVLWLFILWWRGSHLANVYVTLVRASFGMRLGILAFFWVLIFARPTLREESLALLPFFFFFGLLSSGLARAASLDQDKSGRDTLLGRGWIVSLVIIALLVTLVGYGLALSMAGMRTTLLAQTFILLGEGLLTLVFLLLSPVLLLFQGFLSLLKALLPDRISGDLIGFLKPRNHSGHGIKIPWLADLASLVGNGLLIVIAVMLVVMLLALIWFLIIIRPNRDDDNDEEREVLGTGEVIGGLRQTLREGWRRLADMLGILRQFGLGRDLFAVLTIRRIYARMEKLAGDRGYPRAISETPYEYYRELDRAFPGLSPAYQRITEAYIAVRYGDIPESDEELLAVRMAWENLKESPVNE